MKKRPALLLLLIPFALLGCSKSKPKPAAEKPEPATLSRTEFTNRLENYFEYVPLKAGASSQFLIHLTDLADGSPVEKAQVRLTARLKGGGQPAVEATAQIGKVTGIYVADLKIPAPGDYDILFHIQNDKLDERLSLTGFQAQ